MGIDLPNIEADAADVSACLEKILVPEKMKEVSEGIDQIIADYCDGTFDGLKHAHFIEWFGEDSLRGPQEMADRLKLLVEKMGQHA